MKYGKNDIEWQTSIQGMSLIGLCIVYFKWYDTYHDTDEAIFDMYRYILSDFRPQKLDISTNFTGIWEF